MNIIHILTYVILGFVAIFIVFIAVIIRIFRDDIRAFFNPNGWSSITMIESDNTVSNWLQKKEDDLQFEFNGGNYNMFDTSVTKGINKTVVYRSGRLGHFFYVEGNKNPINMRDLQLESTGQAQIDNQLSKIEISRLFQSQETGLDNVIKWLPIVLAVIIIIILVIILSQGNTTSVGG